MRLGRRWDRASGLSPRRGRPGLKIGQARPVDVDESVVARPRWARRSGAHRFGLHSSFNRLRFECPWHEAQSQPALSVHLRHTPSELAELRLPIDSVETRLLGQAHHLTCRIAITRSALDVACIHTSTVAALEKYFKPSALVAGRERPAGAATQKRSFQHDHSRTDIQRSARKRPIDAGLAGVMQISHSDGRGEHWRRSG